jgi:hypothetical protein
MIAFNIDNDVDLLSFVLTCKDFALAAVLDESTVWRARFLARYDYPIIDGPIEFRVAYQLREMVLRNFPSFADGGGARGRHALEVLRDMVLGMIAAILILLNLAFWRQCSLPTACKMNNL